SAACSSVSCTLARFVGRTWFRIMAMICAASSRKSCVLIDGLRSVSLEAADCLPLEWIFRSGERFGLAPTERSPYDGTLFLCSDDLWLAVGVRGRSICL